MGAGAGKVIGVAGLAGGAVKGGIQTISGAVRPSPVDFLSATRSQRLAFQGPFILERRPEAVRLLAPHCGQSRGGGAPGLEAFG